MPDHPRAQRIRYALEHILVVEQKLGRHLLPNELVHHLNGVRDDNRPENSNCGSSRTLRVYVRRITTVLGASVPPGRTRRPTGR